MNRLYYYDKTNQQWDPFESENALTLGGKPVSEFAASEEVQQNIGDILALNSQLDDITYNPKKYNTLQDFFNAAQGKIVILPPGNYAITSTVTIKNGTTLIAYDSKFYVNSHMTIVNLEDNVKIYGLEVQGSGNGTYNANGIGIQIAGSDKDHYIKDILMEDCYIHDIGAHGIKGSFVDRLTINKTKFKNIGYAGIGIISGNNIMVDKCYIDSVSPGTSNNAYGVYFSRIENDSSVLYPRSSNCKVVNSTIENIPIWEALDTHGGIDITFDNNIIKNCKVGIAVVNSDNSTQQETFAPQNCTVTNNKIYGNGNGNGIVLEGVINGEYSSCDIISTNTLINCGENGNNISGAIRLQGRTQGAVISNNTLKNSNNIGICISGEYNKKVTIVGNTIIDVYDNTNTVPIGIGIRSNNNDGLISGNTLLLVDTTLGTYVSKRGISISTGTTGNLFNLGVNNCNFETFYNGLNATNSYFGEVFNGVKIYCASNSPEATVTSNVGSLYLRNNGGANTTLYVKESGTGNTGWTAK